MVRSKIRSLYRDADDLLRTVIKHIWEEQVGETWIVQKIEIIYKDGEPTQPLEYRHGWIIPPEWEFISEVWEYTRQPLHPLPSYRYDHDQDEDVQLLR